MERRGGGTVLKQVLGALDRYKYVLLVVALGALLLLWPAGGGGEEEGVSPRDQPQSLRETEAAMEEILGRIQGVGRVDVMLTLQSGSELVLAEDASLRYSGSTEAPTDYQRTSEPVVADGSVVVRQERYPQYRGALVVCDGGGSDGVRLRVMEAVAALTGLGSDRIAVVPWQSGAQQ